MPDPIPDFIDQLANWLATRLGITRSGSVPIVLWSHALDERVDASGMSNIADPATVVRRSGGNPDALTPTLHATIQFYSLASTAAAAMQQADQACRCLRDNEGQPMQRVQLTDYLIHGFVGITAPGLIGRDAKNRVEAVSNFEAYYMAQVA